MNIFDWLQQILGWGPTPPTPPPPPPPPPPGEEENLDVTEKPVPDSTGCYLTLLGAGDNGAHGPASSTNADGGHGGGGGAKVGRTFIPRSELGDTYTVTRAVNPGESSTFKSGAITLTAGGANGTQGGTAVATGLSTAVDITLVGGSPGSTTPYTPGGSNPHGAGSGGGSGSHVNGNGNWTGAPTKGGTTSSGGPGGTGNGGDGQPSPTRGNGGGGGAGSGGGGGAANNAHPGGDGGYPAGGGGGGCATKPGQGGGHGGHGAAGYTLIEWQLISP